MLETFLAPRLQILQGHEHMVFQQTAATAHAARISTAVLRGLFPQRLISRYGDVPWPPRSPDLSSPDFFIWGYLKCKVFDSRPAKVNGLKTRIRELDSITEDNLQEVMRNSSISIQQYIQRNGAH
jgi:hypothetical protein